MDFPIELRDSWVYGSEELKQNVVARLKNPVGSFIQSQSIGALFSVHSTSVNEIKSAVYKTLEQIPLVSVKNVEVNLPLIDISFDYNGKVVKYQYSV